MLDWGLESVIYTYFRQTTYCNVKTSPYVPKHKTEQHRKGKLVGVLEQTTVAAPLRPFKASSHISNQFQSYPVLKFSTPSIPVLEKLRTAAPAATIAVPFRPFPRRL